jgi:hypothetical protein
MCARAISPAFTWRDALGLRAQISAASPPSAEFFAVFDQANAAGFTVGNPALLGGMVHVASLVSPLAAAPIQIEALERALDGVFVEHFTHARAVFGRVRHRILRALAGTELFSPARGAYYIWATALAFFWSAGRGLQPRREALTPGARLDAFRQGTYVFARYLGDAFTQFTRVVLVLDTCTAVLTPGARAIAAFYAADVHVQYPGGVLPKYFADPVYAFRA